MSGSRLIATAAGMTAMAGVLAVLTPDLHSMTGTLVDAQRTADTTGPDTVVLAATGLAAWAAWSWGVLGLILTAASALPGLPGVVARVVLHVALPAGVRRTAAIALGLGLGVAGPLTGAAAQPGPSAAAGPPALPTAGPLPGTSTGSPVPDMPDPGGAAAPDWPAASMSHVVVPGDCLWNLASDQLVGLHGRTPTDGEVAAATTAWWRANTAVVGPDPDLLLPGQVLSPPDPP